MTLIDEIATLWITNMDNKRVHLTIIEDTVMKVLPFRETRLSLATKVFEVERKKYSVAIENNFKTIIFLCLHFSFLVSKKGPRKLWRIRKRESKN